MPNIRLDPGVYNSLRTLTGQQAAILYVNDHRFTADGYMKAHDTLLAMIKETMPGPITNVVADILIRDAGDIREAVRRVHDKAKEAHGGTCVSCDHVEANPS